MVCIKKENIGWGYCLAFCGSEVCESRASISPSLKTCPECLARYNELMRERESPHSNE